MRRVYFGMLILVALTSCNDRQKKEQALKDLETTQHKLVEFNTYLSDLETTLTRTIAELEVAKDDISQTKEFQLLRTEDEREQQIRKAAEYKLKVEENIESIKLEINNIKDSVTRTETKIQTIKESLKN